MNIHSRYDAIVLGAGGAGLLLLDAMMKRAWLESHRVLVIEPDEKITNDRTWCFWTECGDGLHADIVSHSWTKVNNGLDRIEDLEPYRYSQIRSADFYGKLVPQFKNHSSIRWLSLECTELKELENSACVHAGGHWYQAPLVFDSRSLSRQEGEDIFAQGDWLWQSFLGYRVRTAENAFSEDTCTLMDFRIPQDGESQFVYVLPTSSKEALIELTRFGKSCLSEAYAANILHNYIRNLVGIYHVEETEIGKIPMTLALNPKEAIHPKHRHIIPIGTRAGAVKSTTGYAFKNMAAHAEGIVNALIKNTALPSAYHPQRPAFYDKLLLRVLSTKPHLGQKIFQTLFKRRSTTEVLRFLDEGTNIVQEIKILGILPYTPFIKALFSFKPSNQERKKGLSPEIAVVSTIAVFLVVFNALAPGLMEQSSPWILLAGLIFPGIPHGAVDHWVSLGRRISFKTLIGFIGKYLFLMLAIAALWWVNPIFGLLVFLLYSAWHFGETDMRDWRAFSSLRSWIWGLSVLGTLLFGHYSGFAIFLNAYGAESLALFLEPYRGWILALCILGLTSSGRLIRKGDIKSWAVTVFVLLSGLTLPLITAFALYFIGCHSLRGWRHLQKALKTSTIKMFKMSLPFSLGAWSIGALALVLIKYFDYPISELLPLAFIWIAALSGPHVLIMHNMYRRME